MIPMDIKLENLELVHLGRESKFDLIPEDDSYINKSTLVFDLPPVIPDLSEQLEEILDHPEKLSIYDLDNVQRHIPRKPNISSLFTTELCPLQTTLKAERNMTTGEVIKFNEVIIEDNASNSKNSMSFKRAPDVTTDVKGNPNNLPFWPGGFDDYSFEKLKDNIKNQDIDFVNDLLTIPPGFEVGMKFEKKKEEIEQSVIKLSDILSSYDISELDSVAEGFVFESSEDIDRISDATATTSTTITSENDELEETLSKTPDVLNISETKEIETESTTDWAVEVNVLLPVEDFHQRIPNMAFKYDFELDTFQKQAILHLENNDNVFVAAHTSAGKTVVAEYAIALAMKSMTKAIYTSPIKALSNQKFKDFKKTFEDVGLLTGDIQLNKTASCLIMTTEILRSMLYNGSEVVRNLEWVIFDEVHYINDSERGVVWEEVLIMLPSHVKLVLLSATVPNTLEFADWIGRIKQKKIYVITTLKRPVPLEHHLYTGSGGKSKGELFMIVDAAGNFKTLGYNAALNAKQERTSKHQHSFGPKGYRNNVSEKQDKNTYIGLIEYLRQHDKLPVVCFTLSRKKCDDNAQMLSSVDLTVKEEKGEIHKFVTSCISKLNKSDRKLPQVVTMQQLLKRGLGVHHSGILPILKEVVEMLFERGLIKMLFATETFAMGINMPARTVVFDSIKKHDGQNFRELLPSEYIQMAGRAGRRGKDSEGTVIIMCKADIPETSVLYKMMLGKPTKLESKFRLTYSMILNLLKVHNENLRVEDMMKRSFREAFSQRNVKEDEKVLKELIETFTHLEKLECEICQFDIKQYCKMVQDFYNSKTNLLKKIFNSQFGLKLFSQGRLLTVKTSYHSNTFGVILNSDKKVLKVLLMCKYSSERCKSTTDILDMDEASIKQLPWLPKLYVPESVSSYHITSISVNEIQKIFNKVIKIDANEIFNDWNKQIKNDNEIPGKSINKLVQKLHQMIMENENGLPPVDIIKECGVRDIELFERVKDILHTSEVLEKFTCLTCVDFIDHFVKTFKEIELEKKMNNYKLKLSEKSLQLLPEYQARIRVLQELHYIDNTNTTEMKGKVACAMSNHEIFLTELLVDDVFKSLKPEEIAALLSCTVFQQRMDDVPDEVLPFSLQEGKEKLLAIIQHIGETQVKCGLKQSEKEFSDQYNFNLCNVVYEWAKGTTFSEIMNITTVQEGIIVRCIQRLDEILKDVRAAARTIGNPELEAKTEKASQMIKRDIVFAASLYIQ
ncbi:helicase SKI2W-like [Centruroides sculpturatus]|uniref:helicase SKI2W-like n=1 Tax=Centruroides sculpturatus TaxID=218467 RepID=UPI000C6CDB4B|nr:helicase SKI2W-like [Centruroides sculpturatus]